MKILKHYLIALFLLSSTVLCYATENSDLYTGQASVKSEQASEREAAIQQAFLQVLVKLSGNSQVLQQVKLPTPAQATQWVQQFGYTTKPSLLPDTPPTMFLEADFDEKAVNGFLKRNNIAIWDVNRPITLVWMAVEAEGVQTIVGEYELNVAQWQQYFKDESTARGVNVLFPLLDLADKDQVSINDVWYHVTDALKDSAQRYQADNILSGRVFQNLQTEQWVGNWSLALPAENITWQQEAASPEALMKASVDRFVNELAQRSEKSQMSAAHSSTVTLNVDNVRDAQDYLRLIAYLQSLDSLESVIPVKFTPNAVTFQIKLATSLTLFTEKLATDKRLQPVSSDGNVLDYQYF